MSNPLFSPLHAAPIRKIKMLRLIFIKTFHWGAYFAPIGKACISIHNESRKSALQHSDRKCQESRVHLTVSALVLCNTSSASFLDWTTDCTMRIRIRNSRISVMQLLVKITHGWTLKVNHLATIASRERESSSFFCLGPSVMVIHGARKSSVLSCAIHDFFYES